MSPILYDLSVPVYIRSLENLLNVLKKGEGHAKQNGTDVDSLVQASLGHGMHVRMKTNSAPQSSPSTIPHTKIRLTTTNHRP